MQLAELPFYEWMYETNEAIEAIKECAMSYKVEIIERKDSIVQLETCKSSIKDLLSDLLNETNCFKFC